MDSLLTDVSQFKLNEGYEMQHSAVAGNAVSDIHIGFSVGIFDLTYIPISWPWKEYFLWYQWEISTYKH